MLKYILFSPLIFSLLSPHAKAEDEFKIKCRINIKKFIQYDNEYRMTLYINDEKNDYDYIFGTDLSFTLPLTTFVYNYIKTAYILGKNLCIQYRIENNTNKITRMYDDYHMDE